MNEELLNHLLKIRGEYGHVQDIMSLYFDRSTGREEERTQIEEKIFLYILNNLQDGKTFWNKISRATLLRYIVHRNIDINILKDHIGNGIPSMEKLSSWIEGVSSMRETMFSNYYLFKHFIDFGFKPGYSFVSTGCRGIISQYSLENPDSEKIERYKKITIETIRNLSPENLTRVLRGSESLSYVMLMPEDIFSVFTNSLYVNKVDAISNIESFGNLYDYYKSYINRRLLLLTNDKNVNSCFARRLSRFEIDSIKLKEKIGDVIL